MKIRQTFGESSLAEQARHRLETTAFANMEKATTEVQQLFPNHLVSSQTGRILVFVKDRSFQVAGFQEVHDGWRDLVKR